MTNKIIGVIQVKGGAGRSTVSTNLAGELSKVGKTVLIDCDMPQGTSASWFAVRQQADTKQKPLFSENLVADTATNHRELVAKVEQFKDLIARETLATSFEVKEGAELAVEVAKA